MKRVVRSLLLFFCTTLFMLSASVCVCVVRVHADDTYTNTYIEMTGEDVLVGYSYLDNGNPDWKYELYINAPAGCRATFSFYNSSASSSQISLVCPSSININNTDGVIKRYRPYNNTWDNYRFTSANNTFNPSITSNYKYSVRLGNPAGNNKDQVYFAQCTYGNDSWPSQELIYDKTFGNGAIDPVAPIDWGLVDVKGYQTNIAGQGQASIHNVDVISWDNSIDLNGNDITDGNVRIRIIPGEYRGSSRDDLLSKTNNDFILDIAHATAGNVVPVTDGSISYKWSDVIDALNFSSMSIFNTLHDNDTWFKRGWIYEIRLEIDDYIGEWQSIYASTSSGVENDLTIVNTSVITQNTIIAIQNINSLNNTTNIWIVNDQPVDPNPEQEPPSTENEKPWWVYLLEMINNTLGIQNEYINEGTDESIEVVNNFEDDHTELNTTVNDYDDIENDLVLDMNNNLEQIEVESDLIENNSFLSSARWIAEQYTTIVTDNPIGSILKFSLVLGFVMIFLGRFK